MDDHRVGQLLRMTSTKWDGTAHRDHPARFLGRDEIGGWLWVPNGEQISGPSGFWTARGGLRLVPEGDLWWSAHFIPDDDGDRLWTYVDIATPSEWTASAVTFVDLDLDVEQSDDGPVAQLDQDEFEENRARMSIPEDVAAQAVRTWHQIAGDVRDQVAPFDGRWRRWLALAKELGL